MLSFTASRIVDDPKGVPLDVVPQIGWNFSRQPGFPLDHEELKRTTPIIPEPSLDEYSFAHKAEPTDVVSDNVLRLPAGIWVSQRLKTVIESCALGNHAFYPADILKPKGQQGTLRYYFLHFATVEEDIIDFSSSQLVQGTPPHSELNIQSFEEIDEGWRSLKFPRWKKVALKERRDCFRLYKSTDLLVSPHFKEILTNAKATGMVFEDAILKPTVSFP